MAKVVLRNPGSIESHEVRLDREPDGAWRVTVGDETVRVEDQGDGGLGTTLRVDGRVLPVRTLRRGATIEVWLAGRRFVFERAVQTAQRASGADAAGLGGDLTAPMPGTILDIRVGPGDAFEAHAPLIVMESMKMEMTLSAPAAGRVREVLCTEGELVEMGELLVRIEPAEATA